MCVLLAVHDLNQALRVADRVMVLARGRLVAIGTPREVVTPRLLEDVYGVRARIEASGPGATPYVIVDGSAFNTAWSAGPGGSGEVRLRAAE